MKLPLLLIAGGGGGVSSFKDAILASGEHIETSFHSFCPGNFSQHQVMKAKFGHNFQSLQIALE